jgi:thioesterase domain-containing protein
VARQLESKGERVELVAIFDGVLPGQVSRTQRLLSQTGRARDILRAVVRQPNLLPVIIRQKLAKLAAESARLRALRQQRSAAPGQLVDVEIDSPAAATDVHNFAARVTETGARLLVVRATNEGRPAWTAEHLGWRGLAKRFVARDVPASHLGLLQEPHVREVAGAIAELLAAKEAPDSTVEVKPAV